MGCFWKVLTYIVGVLGFGLAASLAWPGMLFYKWTRGGDEVPEFIGWGVLVSFMVVQMLWLVFVVETVFFK